MTGARTDKVPTGPYRGAGRPEAAYLLELTVDAAARELGIEPAELRRRNLIRSFPHRTALGWTYDSGDYERCLELALELVVPERSADERRAVGTGLAMYVERAGGMWESALVTVEPSGRVVARSASSPHGQGHETTFASRSMAMGGSALVVALEALVAEAGAAAARLLGVAEGSLSRSASAWVCADGRRATLAEIAAAAGGLTAEARFESGLVFGSGAYAAVVEIDRATGQLRVCRLAAVAGAGPAVHRRQAVAGAAGARLKPAPFDYVAPRSVEEALSLLVLGPGELLVEIEVPALPAGGRTAFVEHARTHGDFATAGAAVVLAPDGAVAIAVLGMGGRPTRIGAAELATAPAGDDYRWALLAELVSRALSEAS